MSEKRQVVGRCRLTRAGKLPFDLYGGSSLEMLLVYPPVGKPCEPPAGLARLQGCLQEHGVRCTIWDANLECLLHLLRSHECPATDTWTGRALRSLPRNLAALKSPKTYRSFDRYKRAVMDVNRVLELSSGRAGIRVSLSNYQDRELSPVRSDDLLSAAENPEQSPFYPYFSHQLPSLLDQLQPSLVGFSLNFLNQALTTFSMIGFLKRHCPGLTIALGGGLVTSWARRPGWSDPFGGLVDHLVAGPGEVPLLSLSGIDRPEVKSCLPNYGAFPLGDYLAPGAILPYSASSGCYWSKCSFCPERAEGNPYRPIPAGKAAEQLRQLAQHLRPSMIHLLDNAVSPALLRALTETPPGPPWYGFVRVTEHLADHDFCRALRQSGCVMLKLGLESGDQHVLDRMCKGADIETASRALNAISDAGIATYVYLLFGTPSESREAARNTLDFTVRHSGSIDFLNLALFNLPVYGPEAVELDTHMHYEGDLSLYAGFHHPKGWSRELVRQFLDKEFKRHPAIAPILRRDPPFFTSNHAAFFTSGRSSISRRATSCSDEC